jgi:hypothetical protein
MLKKVLETVKKQKDAKITFLCAFLILGIVGLACNFNLGGEKAELPSDSELQSLVKQTTADFASALEKENFTDFLKNSSSELQAGYTPEKMKEGFKDFIDKKELVLPIVKDSAKEVPAFSPKPALREEKGYTLLNANGEFPTTPNAVKFKYEYVRRDGKWQLLKIEINL